MNWKNNKGFGKADPMQREVDLAWELYEAQPTNPEIARIAARVLAQQPDRNGTRILLAKHLRALGEQDRAREILHEIVSQRDRFYLNAARELRDLELFEDNNAAALRWARAVVREDQESADDVIELGAATALAGEVEQGWDLMDRGVALTASTSPDDLGAAYLTQAIALFQTFAPPERFIKAAEQAVHVDPTSEFVGVPLAWSYMHEGRFDEAEELCRRLLRIDPTNELQSSVLGVIMAWRGAVEKGVTTLAEIHDAGVVTMAWTDARAKILGIDLASALAELERVMPADLRAALRPPADAESANASPGERDIATWHDGQEPGTGSLWGGDWTFRVMSAQEITVMDEAIEADPEAFPQWPQTVADYYVQVMTDDAGGYFIGTISDALVRRPGLPDEVVAPSLADWFWDRVVAFGGKDARKGTGSTRRESTGDVTADAWIQFEERLAQGLSLVTDRTFLVISVPDDSRYVQFAGAADRLDAEASGIVVGADERVLMAAGWTRPGTFSPNWTTSIPRHVLGSDATDLARMCVEALRDSFALASPDALRYSAWRNREEVPPGQTWSAERLRTLDPGQDPLILPALGLQSN